MSTLKKLSFVAALGLAAFASPAQSAGIELGQLNCKVDGGVGFVFGSSKKLNCVFTSVNDNGARQRYSGKIQKYGVDLGFTGDSVIIWTVVAAENSNVSSKHIRGTYSGASASAALAVGLGANVLIGGSENSIALQPVSVSGETGVNVAAGFARITLR